MRLLRVSFLVLISACAGQPAPAVAPAPLMEDAAVPTRHRHHHPLADDRAAMLRQIGGLEREVDAMRKAFDARAAETVEASDRR